jgi:transcriptional regulator with GAF, ATPase, and Fis domain
MTALDLTDSGEAIRAAAFAAVSAAFGSLGRICLALDGDFRVRHVSDHLDALLGAGAAASLQGQPVERLFGPELFGPGGPLRQALVARETREGWRASLRVEPAGSRLVSLSAAPLRHDASGVCDREAVYIVVMRPTDETDGTAAQAPTGFAGLIARSAEMARIFKLVENLQQSEVTVLLSGESGTGKEVLGRAIHARSLRRDGPFVAVNCAALPGDLLESELFGHVRGAFTGAVRDRAGRFEVAARGTLFLDEAGDLPLHLQVKLLRVLQERTFERVGENRTREADVRIVAATNRDLRRAVEEGTFREDLYYRLRVFPIEIPPLRERREDIHPLARHLLARIGRRTGRAFQLSPDALRALLAHRWPGNVRELENALEYACTVSRWPSIQPADLPTELNAPWQVPASPAQAAPVGSALPAEWVSADGGTGSTALPDPREGGGRRAAGRREEVVAALESRRWRVAEAARQLGISRTTLWRRMRELGLR